MNLSSIAHAGRSLLRATFVRTARPTYAAPTLFRRVHTEGPSVEEVMQAFKRVSLTKAQPEDPKFESQNAGWQQVLTERRAAIDVGSGTTKITVADIDLANNAIVKIYHQYFMEVGLRKDLAAAVNEHLSQMIEQELIQTLQSMQETVGTACPVKWVGVGTSVFRRAKNTNELLDRVRKATQIDIRVIQQKEEAEIGFTSAVAVSGMKQEEVIAWDSGDGSFQISSLIDGKLEMYGAEFAYVGALEALFTHRKQAFSPQLSPNPVNRDEALALVDIICSKLPPLSHWLADHKKQIVTFGDNMSLFSCGRIATGSSCFTQEQVWKGIEQVCSKSDEELGQFPNRRKAVVGLILLYAMMKHCGMQQVHYFPANGNCEGMLITSHLWKQV